MGQAVLALFQAFLFFAPVCLHNNAQKWKSSFSASQRVYKTLKKMGGLGTRLKLLGDMMDKDTEH